MGMIEMTNYRNMLFLSSVKLQLIVIKLQLMNVITQINMRSGALCNHNR